MAVTGMDNIIIAQSQKALHLSRPDGFVHNNKQCFDFNRHRADPDLSGLGSDREKKL